MFRYIYPDVTIKSQFLFFNFLFIFYFKVYLNRKFSMSCALTSILGHLHVGHIWNGIFSLEMNISHRMQQHSPCSWVFLCNPRKSSDHSNMWRFSSPPGSHQDKSEKENLKNRNQSTFAFANNSYRTFWCLGFFLKFSNSLFHWFKIQVLKVWRQLPLPVP